MRSWSHGFNILSFRVLFGFALRGIVPELMVLNANMHYNPEDNMAEYESAFVFKASNLLYPVVEICGEIIEDETTAYSLLGLKFRIADEIAWGFSFQFDLTDTSGKSEIR